MSEPGHVGSEIEAYCGSCKDVRWHVIVAMVAGKPVKVECVSCKKHHGFRTGPAVPGGAAPGGAPRAKKTAVKRALAAPSFDLSALRARSHEAKAYAPSETFAAGDVVRHPTFGLGIVAALAGPQRIDARFEAGPKTLVHDRKAGPK